MYISPQRTSVAWKWAVGTPSSDSAFNVRSSKFDASSMLALSWAILTLMCGQLALICERLAFIDEELTLMCGRLADRPRHVPVLGGLHHDYCAAA
jgi:hypothetical protein